MKSTRSAKIYRSVTVATASCGTVSTSSAGASLKNLLSGLLVALVERCLLLRIDPGGRGRFGVSDLHANTERPRPYLGLDRGLIGVCLEIISVRCFVLAVQLL
jgi:hypothetical protein